jgi:anti-anti-sigma factor
MTVTELDGPVTRVGLSGRLDAPGADQIGVRFTASVAARGQPAIVDLSGVTFVASMGLRLLISAARAMHVKGRQMVLFGATGPVREVLEQAAIDQIIPLLEDEAQALEHLRG